MGHDTMLISNTPFIKRITEVTKITNHHRT